MAVVDVIALTEFMTGQADKGKEEVETCHSSETGKGELTEYHS